MYHKLLTKKIKFKQINKNKNKNITNDILVETLQFVAVNYPFSTFPYILLGVNSKKSFKYFKSGNCISLSIAGQNYLKKKYNIKSFLIPASIPKIFQSPGYLHISHVALYIPQNKHKGYVLDFSFYFKEPMIVNFKNNNTFNCKMMNIYHGIEEELQCNIGKFQKKNIFNEYQSMPKNTKFVNTYYNKDPSDSWNYYIREIINPDKAITNFYINIKKYPFLCILDENYNFKLYIKFIDDQTFLIKEYQNTIFQGNLFELSFDILNKIKPIIGKFFNYNILSFLNKFNPDKLLFFKDSKKTKKNKLEKIKKKRKKLKKTKKNITI